MKNRLGEKLNPILIEIENTIWDMDIRLDEGIVREPHNYSLDGFRAASKIFMSTLLDQMWKLQEKENIPQQDREKMAEKAGQSLREFIKIYTNIDTHDLYK